MHPTIRRLHWIYFTVEFYFITGNAFTPNIDKSTWSQMDHVAA